MVFPSCSTVRIFYIASKIQKLLLYIDVENINSATQQCGKMNTYKVNSNGADVAIQIGIILEYKGIEYNYKSFRTNYHSLEERP